MRIYIFTEHYPSPFKPYLNTQFEQFLKDNHELRIFALGHYNDKIEKKVSDLGLDILTCYLPTTLSKLPGFALSSISAIFCNPLQRISAAFRIVDHRFSFKRNFINIIRMLHLPLSAPDLCLVHNLVTMRSLCFLRNLYPGITVAFYYHGGEVFGVPNVSTTQALVSFAASDVVFTNTENSKIQAINRGCIADKIKVIPVGFNISEFRPPNHRQYLQNGILHLLSIGRLSIEKGLIYALEGLVDLMNQGVINWRYRIVGNGPLEIELKSYVQENLIKDKVDFLGTLSRENIFSELQNADVLLLPSVIVGTCQETQACVVQEAMLMKTLVVTTSIGGVPESIAPEMLPFNVPPEDPFSIAKSICDLLCLDQLQWQTLGQACRDFVVSHYDISILSKKLLEHTSNHKNSIFNNTI